jgi:DNA-directed RNA polymerase specialized sigma24 family protein
MDALRILADHHKEWVKIVRSFGEYDLAEDVVQDVYLRIVKVQLRGEDTQRRKTKHCFNVDDASQPSIRNKQNW